MCPKCRRTPLCKKHLVPGTRECASCVFDQTIKELTAVKEQEQGLRHFFGFLIFVAILVCIFFVSLKMGLVDTVEIIQNSIIIDSLPYIGGAVVLGYLLFNVMRYNLKNNIKELGSRLKKIEFRR